jgi:hypothetical protein
MIYNDYIGEGELCCICWSFGIIINIVVFYIFVTNMACRILSIVHILLDIFVVCICWAANYQENELFLAVSDPTTGKSRCHWHLKGRLY